MKKKFLFTAIVFVLLFLSGRSVIYAYSDVDKTSEYAEAIDGITALKITKGYPQNIFRPDAPITRAEFMKMLILAKFTDSFEAKAESCFKDVKETQWFSSYICYAKQEKIVTGYPNGTFQPDHFITMAEASKMLVGVLEPEKALKQGVYWYSPFVNILANDAVIPKSVHYINQELTREEVAEMLWRMIKKIHNRSSVVAADLEKAYCQKSPENLPSNIDMDTVRTTWLGWYNDARAEQGLPAYKLNIQLDRTATEWSEYSKARGYIDHKREGQTLYYDYKKITEWFKNLGVEFKNINRVTSTENINWGVYSCSADDCTQKLLDSIRTGFDFFMNEKDKAYKPHYDSIMNSQFKEIGLGIAIDSAKKKYYLTVHYGTEITSHPLPVCGY